MTTFIDTPENPICDFCSCPQVFAIFDAEDFVQIPGVMGSRGGWMACEDCAPLVEARDWSALATRALEAHCQREPSTREFYFELRGVILAQYQQLGTLLRRAN